MIARGQKGRSGPMWAKEHCRCELCLGKMCWHYLLKFYLWHQSSLHCPWNIWSPFVAICRAPAGNYSKGWWSDAWGDTGGYRRSGDGLLMVVRIGVAKWSQNYWGWNPGQYHRWVNQRQSQRGAESNNQVQTQTAVCPLVMPDLHEVNMLNTVISCVKS